MAVSMTISAMMPILLACALRSILTARDILALRSVLIVRDILALRSVLRRISMMHAAPVLARRVICCISILPDIPHISGQFCNLIPDLAYGKPLNIGCRNRRIQCLEL